VDLECYYVGVLSLFATESLDVATACTVQEPFTAEAAAGAADNLLLCVLCELCGEMLCDSEISSRGTS
jgi:hypothetical protein